MEDAALDIFLPVMESATVLAGHYAKMCNRDIITQEDMSMGLMYAARHVTGKHLGSLYPELYESDSEDEDEDVFTDEEVDWIRYTGSDDIANRMNECLDTWDEWVPSSPAERLLKNAVDKSSVF